MLRRQRSPEARGETKTAPAICAAGPAHAAVNELAAVISAVWAFVRLPILADAATLDHCRRPGPHVGGCRVVDLLLGKG